MNERRLKAAQGDVRSSAVLADEALRLPDGERRQEILAVLQARGSAEEFELAD